MTTRSTLMLIAAAVCAHSMADGWFYSGGSSDDALTGVAFEIRLINDIVITEANGDVSNNRLLGIALWTRSPMVLLVGEFRHALNYDRCEQKLTLSIAACSARASHVDPSCVYLPYNTQLYKGPGGCEL